MTIRIEITDTYGWYAYDRVRNLEFRHHGKDSTRAIVKAVKREAGLVGRHVTRSCGNAIRIYFPESNVIVSIDAE